MRLGPARLAYLLGAGLLLATYYLVPAARPVATGAIGVLSVAAIGFGVATFRPQRRGGWALIAVSVAVITAGNVAFALAVARGPLPPPFPGLHDVLYLVLYLPLAVGLLWLGQPALPSREYGMLLDTVNLSLAGSLVIWFVVIRPEVSTGELDVGDRIAATAAWVGFVAVLSAVARILLDWYRDRALWVLGAGVIGFIFADVIYLAGLVRGVVMTGGLVELGYSLFSILCGVAALMPSMALVASHKHARHPVGQVRLALLALVLLVGPTLLLVQATTGAVTAGVAIGIVSAAIAINTVLRIAVLALSHRKRSRQQRATRMAARSMLTATTEGDVVGGLDEAMTSMLTDPARHEIRLVDGEHASRLMPVDDTGRPASRNAAGRLWLPLRPESTQSITRGRPRQSAPRALRFDAPMEELVELAPTLRGLADQAGLALERIALVGRLRAEERERHFRTLVLTSRDVTLISRHGRVEYATPSAEPMFGRDVRGSPLDQILSTQPPLEPTPNGAPAAAGSTRDDGVERYIVRPDGSAVIVLLRERDLSQDPTVNGIVTTLQDVTAERNLRRDLAHRASHDPLTGLANAELLSIEMREEDAGVDRRSSPEGTGRAALYIDLDDFKSINDTYGHEAGDAILRTTAMRIESCLRRGDVAARLGGDEFAVLLRGLPDRAAARSIAQRIAEALSQPADVDGMELICRASIGLAYADERDDAQTLLRHADAALYTAKSVGKGRWSEYQAGMLIPTRKRVDVRQRILGAMESGGLSLRYQPIVELDTGEAIGFEALLRVFDHGDPMTPQEMIKAAEDTGLIGTLGEWILARALRDLSRLNSAAGQPGPAGRARFVSVNISPEQLRQSDFVAVVRRQLAIARVDPSMLVLEITEHARVDNDRDGSWGFLSELRRDGTRIAIDDYGTGFASLSYIRQPGIDMLKLDQSFMADATSPRGTAILRGVVSLTSELGLTMIAEGVSQAAARDVLIELGCRYGQGFLFAPALPVEEAGSWSPRHSPSSRRS